MVFNNSILAGASAAGGEFYGYQIDNSLRLNRNDSANLSRTPSSAGNRQTHTISMWVKRSELGRTTRLFGATNNSSNATFHFLEFNSDDTIRYYAGTEGSSAILNIKTNAVFRDVSAWYHIVAALDTTQATSSNRVKLYVNGTQITSLANSTYGSQNANYQINNTNVHYINKDGSSLGNNFSTYYIAEFNFIDGQQLDPTSFGETKSGVWIPKEYTGSYGTNGFYLAFSDSSNIGDDTSGNTNDFTPVNLDAIDVTLDSPTDNFATLNPLIRASTYGVSSDPAPTNGNLNIAMPGGTNNIAVSTFELVPPNKYRCSFELTSRGTSTNFELGICNVTDSINNGDVFYNSSGTIGNESGTQQSGLTSANTVGDIVEILIDLDANNVKFALKENGTSTWVALGTAESITANLTNPIVWVREQGSSNINGKFDFGQLGYVGSDDENYFPMSTANLPEPAISPLDDDVPEDYFDTALWTGNGTSQSISDYQFSPDFVWIKERNSTSSHSLYNTIMGTDLFLRSDTTDGEISNTVNLTSFDTNGFSLGSGGNTNENNNTYVGWSWLAGGTAVSNTDGSVNSSVSVNSKAGFSIVSFTSPASGNFTAGHGLGVTPEVIIQKERGSTGSWHVWHESVTTNTSQFLKLETTGGVGSVSNVWGASVPNSTTFGLGVGVSVDGNNTQIAYCFHSVEGYSKIGSYTGNGSNDGTFVYLGFRPSFIMTKRTNSTSDWIIQDSVRQTFNPSDAWLKPNSNAVEGTTSPDLDLDFVSNGFKIRNNGTNSNISGSTYIYMAFAEMPFKYANAR